MPAYQASSPLQSIADELPDSKAGDILALGFRCNMPRLYLLTNLS